MEKDHTIFPNPVIGEQLVQLQDDFVWLKSDNVNLTIILQSELHVKKLLLCQETRPAAGKLKELKAMVELENQEAAGLH
jgi:hypothetical protein